MPPQRQRIPFPQRQQQAPLPPEGMEFFVQPGGAPGLQKIGAGQRGTEFERSLEGLSSKQRGQAISIRQGRTGRAGIIKVPGAGGGAPVQLSLNPADPKAQVVSVTVKKPGDVKTIREMQDKITGLPAERAQKIVDQAEHLIDLHAQLNETVKVIVDGVDTVRPKYGKKGNEFIQKRIDLKMQEYQRDAGTDGIRTAGGPGLPGTEFNPYKPATETEMNYLEPLDYMVDKYGELRQWQADVVAEMTAEGVSSRVVLNAAREKYIKEHPRQRPVAPEGDVAPKVRSAGPSVPKKPAKPKDVSKPVMTKDELKKRIETLGKALSATDEKGNPRIRSNARVKMINRLTRWKKQLDELSK